MTDLSKPAYKVSLRITIEGRNLIIKTRPQSVFSPIQLVPGQPVLIDYLTLQPYFNMRNLDVEGMDKLKFQTNGNRLPEGFYNICIEAVDFNQPQSLAVSNIACAQVQMVEYDPPLLMEPSFENTVLFDEQPPVFQQALFMWQPLHFGFFPVEYQLDIFKGMPGLDMLPGGAIMQYTAPYIRVKTANTFYNLSPMDPPLLQNTDYYAVVTVTPVQYPAVFKNQGKSQHIRFNLSNNGVLGCSAPKEYKGSIDRMGIALQWKSYQQCQEYITEYYQESDGIRRYQRADIKVGGKLVDTLTQVLSNEDYVVRTGCRCASDTLYSDTVRLRFVRPKAEVPEFECGVPHDTLPAIQVLLPSLQAEDTVVAADFEVIIRDVIVNNGRFSGKGHVVIPLVKYARFNVVFKDILVNDEYRMVGGEMKVIGVGQNVLSDEWLDFIDSLNVALKEISDYLDNKIGELDSLNQFVDDLGMNGPPWLIDSLTKLRKVDVSQMSDEEGAEIRRLIEELLAQQNEWELMYVNIVIATLEDIKDDNDLIKENIEDSFVTQLESIKNISVFPITEDEDVGGEESDIDFFFEIVVHETYTIEEYKQEDSEYGNTIYEFSKANQQYSNIIMVERLLEELKSPLEVIKLIQVFVRTGEDIIPKIKQEFTNYEWNLDKISENEKHIVEKCKQYIADAINTVYWNLN